jgi:NDP-sugar pyrophosphorylase family protein
VKHILICPSERPSVGFLAQSVPLVAVPVLGQNLLSYWMEALSGRGAKEVLVLATDRPEFVRSVLGDGSRWGLRVQVQAELKELSAEAAAAQFTGQGTEASAAEPDKIIVLDHWPGMEGAPLFRSYRDWFNAVLAWMPQAAKQTQIGLREIQPQIWCGRRTSIAPNAVLKAPCWLGDHVRIKTDAVIGPEAILEDGVVIDSAAEVRSSLVGPDTFVGGLTRVEGSIAWGSTLIDWRSGSCTQVPDPFLLCALGQRYLPESDRNSSGGGWRQTLWTLVTRPWALIGPPGTRFREP